jgi:hypothetical protein
MEVKVTGYPGCCGASVFMELEDNRPFSSKLTPYEPISIINYSEKAVKYLDTLKNVSYTIYGNLIILSNLESFIVNIPVSKKYRLTKRQETNRSKRRKSG